jgi:hypothetical protein
LPLIFGERVPPDLQALTQVRFRALRVTLVCQKESKLNQCARHVEVTWWSRLLSMFKNLAIQPLRFLVLTLCAQQPSQVFHNRDYFLVLEIL